MIFWNKEAEINLLSCLLQYGWKDYDLTKDNFLNEETRKVFIVMEEIHEEGAVIDMVTVASKLKEKWWFEWLWGNSFIVSLDRMISSSNAQFYAERIKKETKRVEMSKIRDKMTMIIESELPIEDNCFELSSAILGLQETKHTSTMDDLLTQTLEYIADRQGKELFWYSFGSSLSFLDKYTRGIQKHTTTRIGAPSNVGKSQLSYNIANSILSQWGKVAFFTLENLKSVSLTNLSANRQKVNSYDILDWTVQIDYDFYMENKDKLFIIDEFNDLNKIFAKTIELQPDVVILDYIALADVPWFSEEKKYDEYAKRVQNFVKKNNVAWIDLSNLPNNTQDEDWIRANGNFYGSSTLKNAVDVGIHMVYFKPFYKYKLSYQDFLSDEQKNFQVVNMIITKNRIGTSKVEQIMKIDFNRWAQFTEATAEEVKEWIDKANALD